MKPHIEYVGTLQNCGFWLVRVPKPYYYSLYIETQSPDYVGTWTLGGYGSKQSPEQQPGELLGRGCALMAQLFAGEQRRAWDRSNGQNSLGREVCIRGV